MKPAIDGFIAFFVFVAGGAFATAYWKANPEAKKNPEPQVVITPADQFEKEREQWRAVLRIANDVAKEAILRAQICAQYHGGLEMSRESILAREIVTLKTNWSHPEIIGTNRVSFGWLLTNTSVEIVRRGKTNLFDLGDVPQDAGAMGNWLTPVKVEPDRIKTEPKLIWNDKWIITNSYWHKIPPT